MTDSLPAPRYTFLQSLAVAVGAAKRALDEVRALKAAPPPVTRFPAVRAWTDAVHYAGDVVSLDGATWQAVRDTGRPPPGDDWLCLAASGVDGGEGRSFTVRGVYDPALDYAALDVVTKRGSSFVARTDNPGECPGPGWQMLASSGASGRTGERGPKGERGPGLGLASMTVSDDGLLTLTGSDGSTVSCDLYPLLSRLRA